MCGGRWYFCSTRKSVLPWRKILGRDVAGAERSSLTKLAYDPTGLRSISRITSPGARPPWAAALIGSIERTTTPPLILSGMFVTFAKLTAQRRDADASEQAVFWGQTSR